MLKNIKKNTITFIITQNKKEILRCNLTRQNLHPQNHKAQPKGVHEDLKKKKDTPHSQIGRGYVVRMLVLPETNMPCLVLCLSEPQPDTSEHEDKMTGIGLLDFELLYSYST